FGTQRQADQHGGSLANLTSIAAAKSVIILQDENVEQVQALRVVLAIDSVLAQETMGEPNHQRLPVVTFTNKHLLANQLDDRLVEIAATNHHLRRHINYIPLSAEDVRHGVETQVSRHRGLSSVYQDLLNFGGQELYIVPAPVGTTFGELLLRSRQSTPICLVSDTGLDLWPEWDTLLDGKRVVMLAENRSAAERNPQTDTASTSFGVRKTPEIDSGTSERFLFIGWNEDASRLAQALEKILPDQSSLTVVRRPNDSVLVPSTFCSTPVRTLSLLQDDPISRPGFLNDIEHVIVFTDQSVDPGTSDTSVLIDLLACRHHSNQISDPRKRFTIVAELRKRSSRHIAGDRLADDLLINDALLASAAVQLAFAPELEQVFAALLSVDNPVELITRHISAWDANMVGSDWDSLLRATCLSTGEIAVGYRRVVADVPEVILNPPRTTRCQEDDEIVLLSRRPRREG
ncbi:MAG: hypothetical protein EBU84_12870, partial [Actinobacteria bacterium]|nr:hypothetical protein [Actinomycetota bacterium]